MDLYQPADLFCKVIGIGLLAMIAQELNALRHFWTWLYEPDDEEE